MGLKRAGHVEVPILFEP